MRYNQGMAHFAVSSWSLHGLLGKARFRHVDGGVVLDSGNAQGDLSLLDLPKVCTQNGIHTIEICHFHFPSIEEAYLKQLKRVLTAHDVVVENILIDAGNLSNQDESERRVDIEMAKRWQVITAKLGAKGNRIDCGRESPTPEAKERSVAALRELAEHAETLGIHVATENFHLTSREPEDLLDIMRRVGYPLKLVLDFGNAEASADKFNTLTTLMPYTTSIHCKANYCGSSIDLDDLHRCLDLLKQSAFDGPITLIYNETVDEWQHILALRDAIDDYL